MGVLFSVPVLLYIVFGAFALWKTGLLTWLWWILPVCWGLTFFLAKLWPADRSTETPPPSAAHFTNRDAGAAELVRKYQEQIDDIAPKDLTDMHFYLRQFESLSKELAEYYHPDAADPFSSLTIPEIAAAIRLVADDLEQLVLQSIPGSRLLTVKQWRSFGDTPKWVNRIRNSVWAGSFLLNPLNIARYGFSRVTVDKVGTNLQSEVLAGIYLRFIRQVGFYLIEMNSGRLRGGADAYRNAFEEQAGAGEPNPIGGAAPSQRPSLVSRPVTIGIVGQVSAGKSSLINYLTGNQQAAVDMLPQTRHVERYTLPVSVGENSQGTVSVDLLDSPGYGVDGANASQQAEIQTALQSSDIMLLVIDGHSPSKAADAATLKQVETWYAEHPNLLPPPIVVVLSHVDLIPPAMQWSPPYQLDRPQTPKGKNISEAIAWTKEELGQFSDLIVDVVAVCSAPEESRRWGLQENVLPAIMQHLESGQSVALLQAFERSVDGKWASTLVDQLKTGGKQLLQLWLEKKRSK